MTDKEKLEKLKKLADAMYNAAMYLTTDASRLHKAMDEYHNFIIHKCKEEPVSEDLEKVSKEWLAPQLDKSYAGYGEAKMMELTRFDGYAMLDAIEFGAKWQEEQMMAKAIDAKIYEVADNDYSICEYTHLELFIDPNTLEKNGFKDNDKVKVIVIKGD